MIYINEKPFAELFLDFYLRFHTVIEHLNLKFYLIVHNV